MKKLIRNIFYLITCLMTLFIVLGLFPKQETKVIKTNQKMVALSYDDGPSPKSTKDLLALLEEYNAHATFFINGNHANEYKELVKMIAESGNEIGNHTLDHVWLSKISEEELKAQVYGNENLLRFLSNQEGEMLLRPPYGDITKTLVEKIKRPIVMWSVDSRDWEVQSVSTIKANVLEDISDGDIIIMHDGYASTVEGTKEVLKELNNQHYQVVSVSELFEFKGVSIPYHEKIKRVDTN